MPRTTKRTTTKSDSARGTLSKYDEKRDFKLTPEPAPKRLPKAEGPLTFVIQKHSATRLHYDFRLEVDGVLKSWAVPKGPSLNPNDKRLATMVEDHPIDYGPFEGIIPKGNYGAGQVIVWDNGTYAPDEDGPPFDDRAEAERQMRRAIDDGKISITMRGRKLKGSWTLVKMQRTKKEWLLIKHKDEQSSTERDILEDERSVISGLTIDDLKNGRLPDPAQRKPLVLGPDDLAGSRHAALPATILPMLATLAERPFSDPRWFFEAKLDGVRAIALIKDGTVKLISRRGLDATKQYPSLARSLAKQPAAGLALDGEIVALDERGVPSFELLQQRLNLTREPDIARAESQVPVYYYVFDVLHADGYDERSAPLEQRKELLARVLAPAHNVLFLDHFDEEGELAYRAAIEHGLEGVVAKKRDSVYEAGTRSRNWLKIKATRSDEFIIGGYTQGEGSRRDTFGALLVGEYRDGKLFYVSNAGSGFNDQLLKELKERLDKMAIKSSPFANEVPTKSGVTWVRPELVAEVKYAQRTRDGNLRAPVFLRLREDKPPEEVQHIEPVEPPAANDSSPAIDPPPSASDVLAQLDNTKDKLILEIEGHPISLTNLNKEFWPKLGRRRALTKRDLIRYYAQVSPYLLPNLRDRPLTLTRYPNGINRPHFYQKHWDAPLPEFVDTVQLYSSTNEGDQEYLICNNLPTLLWLGQIGDLELHTWYSRVSPEPDGRHLSTTFTGSEEQIERSLLNYPDFIVFDIDPYIYSGKEKEGAEPELNRKAFTKTCQVARWLKDLLDSLSLSSYVKTTGKTGLHIYAPILRELTYDETRAACETIGRYLMQQHPNEITMEWSTEKRKGKVFFDHNQNVRGKTLASIYSPRVIPEAAVSMAILWDELEGVYPSDFTILTAPSRLAQTGDLWTDILQAKHDFHGLLNGDSKGNSASNSRRRKKK
jgi:bifunctional non-homologous end joining protein LigD